MFLILLQTSHRPLKKYTQGIGTSSAFSLFFLMEQIKPYGSSPWKEKLYQTIFQTNTRAGKLFNAVLLLFIIISVTIVALERL